MSLWPHLWLEQNWELSRFSPGQVMSSAQADVVPSPQAVSGRESYILPPPLWHLPTKGSSTLSQISLATTSCLASFLCPQLRCQWLVSSYFSVHWKSNKHRAGCVPDTGSVQPTTCHWQGRKARLGEHVRVAVHATALNVPSPSKNPSGSDGPVLSNSFWTWLLFPACAASWVISSISWLPVYPLLQ